MNRLRNTIMGSYPPSSTDNLWIDTSTGKPILKCWYQGSWTETTTSEKKESPLQLTSKVTIPTDVELFIEGRYAIPITLAHQIVNAIDAGRTVILEQQYSADEGVFITHTYITNSIGTGNSYKLNFIDRDGYSEMTMSIDISPIGDGDMCEYSLTRHSLATPNNE